MPPPDYIEASLILRAAEWAQAFIQLDDLGYVGNYNIGCVLQYYGNPKEAMERLALTSSMHRTGWALKKEMAIRQAEQKEYDAAITTMEEAMTLVGKTDAQEDDSILSDMHYRIAEWHFEAGRRDAAFQRYQTLIEKHPSQLVYSSILLIEYLHQDKQYERMLEFLQNLKDRHLGWNDDPSSKDVLQPPLTQLFLNRGGGLDFSEAMIGMISTGRGFHIAFESYQAAIAASKHTILEHEARLDIGERAFLMHQLAFICYTFCEHDQERREFAIDLWEQTLQLEEQIDNFTSSIAKHTARLYLASAYFDESQRIPETSPYYLKQLEDLALLDTTIDIQCRLDESYPKKLIARYHAIRGDEKSAFDTLRIDVKLNLDILVDDDPENDWQGFQGLAESFMYAGQDDDCLAAWSLITPNDQPPTDDASNDGLEWPVEHICVGCGSTWTLANDMYVCRQCESERGNSFDTSCLERIRRGDLPWCCNKNHEMLHIPAYDPVERQRIGDGNVKVGQEIMTVNDWLQRIRVKWDIKPAC